MIRDSLGLRLTDYVAGLTPLPPSPQAAAPYPFLIGHHAESGYAFLASSLTSPQRIRTRCRCQTTVNAQKYGHSLDRNK